MARKSFVPLTLVSLCLLVSIDTSQVMAANMRTFIEAVRRKATVVYVGSVKEVHLLTRTKFDIKARAVVDVLAVVRGPGMNPREATIEYSSFDDKTPMLEGGPQYQLRPGVKVVVFANSFASPIPPGYLLQGSRDELLQRVVTLRDALRYSGRIVRQALRVPPCIQITDLLQRRMDTSLRACSDRPNRLEMGIVTLRYWHL
ncbi:MAG: hypothetical protein DME71_07705 [Verrucomicrobia bacterium]|nr:MAG: hypothetical protein DME71_07705 [Verrucomicrobiota bacterium]